MLPLVYAKELWSHLLNASLDEFCARTCQFLKYFVNRACFGFGNFRFKLPIERIFKEGEDGTGIFVIKTISFVKIRCHTCGYITLIPTFGEFRVTGQVHCEDCGKLILEKLS